MEVNKSARRTRVFAAALALGLVIGAQAYFSGSISTPGGVTEKASVKSPSGEERKSPGTEAGLRPAALPGISFRGGLKPTPSELSKAWTQSTTRLKYLDRCERSGKCAGFDDSAAYSYDLDLRRQQAAELRDFKRIALEWQDQHGGVFPHEAEMVGRFFLATGNDDVKEAALSLMEAAPITKENLDACFSAVENSASGPLMTALMNGKMAAACADESNTARCTSFIKHTMRIGGENLQKAFARKSLEMMNPRTLPLFAKIESQLNRRSVKYLYFKLNREEAERFQRGG